LQKYQQKQDFAFSAIEIKYSKFAKNINNYQETIKNLLKQNKELKLENNNLKKANEILEKNAKNKEQSEDFDQFKSVYDSVKCKKCMEITKNYNELLEANNSLFNKHKEILEIINQLKKAISQNSFALDSVWQTLKKTRENGAMVFEQNKVLKEAVAKQRLEQKISKSISLQLLCIEREVDKFKEKLVAEKIKENCGAVMEFSEEPISDHDLIELSNNLALIQATDCIKELIINKGYAVHMEGILSIMKQNSKTLRKIVINNTQLNKLAAIALLEHIITEKIPIEELNLDENQLQNDDLALLVPAFEQTKIRLFSVQRNELNAKGIEKFCKATASLKTFEKIIVGVVRISEQKELEWKTSFPKLKFERVIISDIDYQYVK